MIKAYNPRPSGRFWAVSWFDGKRWERAMFRRQLDAWGFVHSVRSLEAIR